LLKGRGKHSYYRIISEVLITFKWLLNELKALKDRLIEVDYNALNALKNYLKLNVNLTH
jgi:hypothetical protein